MLLATGLSPVSFGVLGLAMALFANGVHLLGAHSSPDDTDEETASAGKTVALVASAASAISLFFFTIWLIVGVPFGAEDPTTVKIQILYASLGGKFAFLWIGVAFAQVFGWSFKPIGTMCAFLAMLHAMEMGMLASFGTSLHIALIEVVFFIYILVLIGFWLLPYGRISARKVGAISVIAAFATLYLEYVAGGILPIPTT
jgi:hypothetical protein